MRHLIEVNKEQSQPDDTDQWFWDIGPEDDDIEDWRVKFDLPKGELTGAEKEDD